MLSIDAHLFPATLTRHGDIWLLIKQSAHFAFERVPLVCFGIENMLSLVIALVLHLDARMDVVSHIVVLIAALKSQRSFS